MTFGERLRQLRKEKGMTLDNVAESVNLTRPTIYRYEKGIITNVPIETITHLAQLFGVSRPYLMGWSDDRTMTMSEVSILEDNNMFIQAYSMMTQEEREVLSDILIKAYGRYQG